MVTSLRFLATLAIFIGVLIAGLTSKQTTTEAAALSFAAQSPTPTPAPCPASQSWITSTTPPQEIGSPNPPPVGDETNCQFYQFAWQWFLSLAQPSTSTPGNRVFETLRVFQPDQNNQCKNLKGVTGKAAAAKALFVRLRKPTLATIQPVTPGELTQATGQPLYDQNGNIVFYNVFYNQTECEATSAGFKPNTVEIKISWKKLNAPDPTYYTMEANVDNQPMLLGLVGFHLVVNTALHPEFVWATGEHVGNDPDCTNPPPVPASGWSFISKTCSTCATSGVGCNLLKNAPAACKVNAIPPKVKNPPLTGPANQICRVFSDGTDPGPMTNGNNNDTNRFNIDTLNQQIVQGYLAQLPAGNPMKIWQNYFMIGGLWTNGGVPSTTPNEQRGSLELANTTMETFFQQSPNNCFTCHKYVVPPPATNNPLRVSHLACALFPTSMTGCPKTLLVQAKKPAVIRKPTRKK